MNRRQSSREETRRLILEATQSLLQKEGPDRCTMRRVAARAGVAPATVVDHFKNRPGLLEAALHETIEKQLAQALDAIPEGADILTHLLTPAEHMLRFYSGNRELYRVLIRETAFEAPGRSPHLEALDERYFRHLVELLQDAQGAGQVKMDVNLEIAASSFFSLYLGMVMEFLRNPELSVTKAAERLHLMAQQHLQGILPLPASD